MTFEDFIMQAREMKASDIHLTVGMPTVIRVHGELRRFLDLSDQVVYRTIMSILNPEQEQILAKGRDVQL